MLKMLYCNQCKYCMHCKNNGLTICIYEKSYEIVNSNDKCRFLPEEYELKCKDCWNYYNDWECIGTPKNQSAFIDGKLCYAYKDAREVDFMKMIDFWLSCGLYDKERIIGLLNQKERIYNDLMGQ